MIYVCWKSDGGGVLQFTRELSQTFGDVKIHELNTHHQSSFKHLKRLRELSTVTRDNCYITQGPIIYLYCRILMKGKVYCHVHNRSEYDTKLARFALYFVKMLRGEIIFVSNNLRKKEGKTTDTVLMPAMALPNRSELSKDKSGAFISARNHPDKNLKKIVNEWELKSKNRGSKHILKLITDEPNIIREGQQLQNTKIYLYSEPLNLQLMATSGVYISSSTYEAFGLSMLNAVFNNVPVILLEDSGEMFDIFSRYIDADIFSSSCVAGLVDKGFTLLSDQALREFLVSEQKKVLTKTLKAAKEDWTSFLSTFQC